MWTQDGTVADREKYLRILHMFQDKKSATFSIHQISLMGLSEGKAVGEWFGPNTVAQSLKKLVQYDRWSGIRFHVAMDNMIVLSDISECFPVNFQLSVMGRVLLHHDISSPCLQRTSAVKKRANNGNRSY